MKNIFIIFKKELKRFFSDRRMLAALFFPGILIFIVYSLLGNFLGNIQFSDNITNYKYQIVETNNYRDDSEEPSKLDVFLNQALLTFDSSTNIKYIEKSEVESYKVQLSEGKIDLIIDFDDNFENNTSTTEKTNISLFYNGASKESSFIYNVSSNVMNSVYGVFTINIDKNGAPITPNLSDSNVDFLKVISVIVPMILLSLLTSTCASLAPESIAGEKERGTLGLVLITPIRRSELAIGKVSALTVVCLCSGITSFAGLILSLPKMFSGMGGTSINFGALEIISMFFLIISILFLLITFSSFISSFAKSVKEASSYLGPIVGAIIFVGIAPAILDVSNIGFSLVPLLNACYCINSLITGNLNLVYLLLTIVSNFIFSGIFALLMVKMFNNENVMFNTR